MERLAKYRIHIGLFVVGLLVYGFVANERLLAQSSDPHFVYLADSWLHGKLAIDPPPERGDDWAKLETVILDDGSQVSGRRLTTRKTFRIAGGDEIQAARIKKHVSITHHVSFPPFPAVLMIPHAAIAGRQANDVVVTVIVAALVLPLAFAVLRRLASAELSDRRPIDDIWLTLALAFGTVFFFSAVQGRVWFTAHVVGLALTLLYIWSSIRASHPILAGLALGLATLTRAPLAFMFPFFLFEAWRMAGGRAGFSQLARTVARFAVPVVLIAIVAMLYNSARWSELTEFGHSYLAVRQQSQMEQWGMFDVHYLSRNLAVAGTLLPEFSGRAPFVSISGHGLALWFTTPLFLFLLWPKRRGPLHLPLWLTVALVAVPTLFYQNSGWFQFGYRFSLDYAAFLVVLIAVGGRSIGRLARTLIVCGIIINLFGAVTFARHHQYYRTDRATYNSVIAH